MMLIQLLFIISTNWEIRLWKYVSLTLSILFKDGNFVIPPTWFYSCEIFRKLEIWLLSRLIYVQCYINQDNVHSTWHD